MLLLRACFWNEKGTPYSKSALIQPIGAIILASVHAKSVYQKSSWKGGKVEMGLFDRLRSTGQAAADSSDSKADTAGQDATRLIDEGHVLEAEGRLDEAMQCYLDAIRLAPNPARAHLNRGNILLLKGDLQGALDAFGTAIKHKPDYAGAYYNIGNALLGNKQLDEAAESYRQALRIEPDYAEVHCALGVALQGQGLLEEAAASQQRALQINPDLAEAHANLGNVAQDLYSRGNVLLDEGKWDDAVAIFQTVLGIKPDFVEAHNNLAIALQELGRPEDAAASYRRALEIRPDYAEAHFNLGNTLRGLRQFEGAAACYRRALEIKPDFVAAHNNLGMVLQELGQLEDSVESYRHALKLQPEYVDAHFNLGKVLKAIGQFEDAMECYRRTITIRPDYAEVHFNLGLLLLSQGRYSEAWPEYEARYDPSFSARNSIPPDLPFLQWRGESLTGKSIVVWPEQGFGDKIQFARYFPLLKTRGVSSLTLVCKPSLMALLEKADGVDAVVAQSEAASLPFHDYWAFSMSLPLHFATTVETIPAKLPYLSAPPERINRWRSRLPTGGLKVGLVWKGSPAHTNDANRSLPSLSILEPLWSVPGVTFISLQKGQGEEEAATPTVGQPIIDLGPEIQDFADTAAIVAQLDLVICIDSAVAHLTGALNKPCWVLLPAIGVDWRWHQERTDSPWYPGVMRLFRQTKAGDWMATIGGVAQALETWVDERALTIQA
jgi:tetratricopeptide (TPR) repeat protein